MTILAVDGAEIYYELHGEGPPLVLIHGASGTHLSWWQQVAELRYRHSCLIYDLRGYGRSRPTGDYDPGDGHAHVRDIEALIEHVGFGSERISLMGASLGTAPALHYAAKHPDRIDKLVLCCGPGNVSTPRIKEGWVKRRERMAARYREVKEHGLVLPPGIPAVRSDGEKERFSTAYHPYGPVGESLHLDFPALTFLYAEIMASAGGPPTAADLPRVRDAPGHRRGSRDADVPGARGRRHQRSAVPDGGTAGGRRRCSPTAGRCSSRARAISRTTSGRGGSTTWSALPCRGPRRRMKRNGAGR